MSDDVPPFCLSVSANMFSVAVVSTLDVAPLQECIYNVALLPSEPVSVINHKQYSIHFLNTTFSIMSQQAPWAIDACVDSTSDTDDMPPRYVFMSHIDSHFAEQFAERLNIIFTAMYRPLCRVAPLLYKSPSPIPLISPTVLSSAKSKARSSCLPGMCVPSPSIMLIQRSTFTVPDTHQCSCHLR